MPEKERSAAGGILVTIGTILFVFVMVTSLLDLSLGPITALLREYIFIPIVLIFAGRAMIRRAKRSTPPPVTVGQPQRRNRLEEFQRWAEEQVEASRPPVPAPRAPTPTPRAPAPASRPAPKPAAHEEPLTTAPLYVPPPKSGGFTPKTSEEMIAEAKRRLESKGRH